MTNQPAERFKKRNIGSCPSGCVTIAYDLNCRLDESIVPFIEPLGRFAFPFGKTPLLKLECQGFTVSGIKRLKEIRVVLQKGTTEKELQIFETALNEWLTKVGG